MRKYVAGLTLGAGLVAGIFGGTSMAAADSGVGHAGGGTTTIGSPPIRSHGLFFMPCRGSDSCLTVAYNYCDVNQQGTPIEFAGGIVCTNVP